MINSISDDSILKKLEEYLTQYEKKQDTDQVYLMFLKRIISNLGSGYYKDMHESKRVMILSDDLKRVGFYDLAAKVSGQTYVRRYF